MSILFTINGHISYLVREDMVNLTILENDMDAKPWMIYIDELLYIYHISNTTNMETTLHQMHHSTELAVYWCNIPKHLFGLYDHSSRASITTKRFNVSDFLPCGAIVNQYYVADASYENLVIDITVPEIFHINISFPEVHVTLLHVQSTFTDVESEGSCHYYDKISMLYLIYVSNYTMFNLVSCQKLE